MIALTIILGYALMVWITSLFLGIWSWDNEMDELDWVLASFWPLTLLFCLLSGLIYVFNWIWDKIPNRNGIESIVRKLCIVFKPFQIGIMIRGWIRQKKDKKFLKKEGEK